MAAITFTQIQAMRDSLMGPTLEGNAPITIIVAKPEATSDATPGVFLLKDPDPAWSPSQPRWRAYSYLDLVQ